MGDITSAPLNVDSATSLIAGLLSDSPEDKRTREAAPEPSSQPTETAKLAPTAPESTDPEPEPEARPDDVDPEAEPIAPAPEIRTIKVKLPDGEKDLPEDEVAKGYLRNADYTRKTQELAQARREFEEKQVAEARAQREETQTTLSQLKQVIEQARPKEPDWPTLRANVPAEVYAAEREAWDLRAQQLAEIETAQTHLKAEEEKQAAIDTKNRFELAQAKLLEAIPDLADATKGPVLGKAMLEFADSRGFTREEFAKVAVQDPRLIVLLHDAMLGAQSKAKAPEIKNKITQALASANPGPSRSSQPQKSKADEAKARLRQTGKMDDAAAAISLLVG